MMGDNRAAAFVDDGGMSDALGIANVRDVPNHVVGVFLKRIISRTVEIAPGSVVIDAEPAPNIEITELVAELGKFCVVARGFANGTLDRGNIRNLRTDV